MLLSTEPSAAINTGPFSHSRRGKQARHFKKHKRLRTRPKGSSHTFKAIKDKIKHKFWIVSQDFLRALSLFARNTEFIHWFTSNSLADTTPFICQVWQWPCSAVFTEYSYLTSIRVIPSPPLVSTFDTPQLQVPKLYMFLILHANTHVDIAVNVNKQSHVLILLLLKLTSGVCVFLYLLRFWFNTRSTFKSSLTNWFLCSKLQVLTVIVKI